MDLSILLHLLGYSVQISSPFIPQRGSYSPALRLGVISLRKAPHSEFLLAFPALLPLDRLDGQHLSRK